LVFESVKYDLTGGGDVSHIGLKMLLDRVRLQRFLMLAGWRTLIFPALSFSWNDDRD